MVFEQLTKCFVCLRGLFFLGSGLGEGEFVAEVAAFSVTDPIGSWNGTFVMSMWRVEAAIQTAVKIGPASVTALFNSRLMFGADPFLLAHMTAESHCIFSGAHLFPVARLGHGIRKGPRIGGNTFEISRIDLLLVDYPIPHA